MKTLHTRLKRLESFTRINVPPLLLLLVADDGHEVCYACPSGRTKSEAKEAWVKQNGCPWPKTAIELVVYFDDITR